MSLTPIFVCSSGRSGSTLMMRLMSAHEQIVGRTLFPYETRASQYYHACAKQGAERATGQKINYLNVDYFPFQGNDDRSNGWFNRNKLTPLGAGGMAMTQPYYEFIGTVEAKKNPVYFVEKSVGWQVMEEMHALVPGGVRMILLTRDPRDIFFSIKSFNAKRGQAGRGFGEEQGDERMFTNLLNYPRTFLGLAEKYGNCAIPVRYEEVVSNPQQALSKIFAALNLGADAEQLERIVAQGFAEDENVLGHRTTEDDVSTSVGRWKKNADSNMLSFFDRFGTDLQTLGYE